MVCLKYPIILLSKLSSGLWICPDNMFSYKYIVWFEANSTCYSLHFSVRFSQKICDVDVDKRKKITS